MPRGQVVTIPSGTGQLITTLSREEMDSVAILNPNDGVAYVKLNSAANPTTPAWDWKVPSQSYAQLPGPYQSLGLWYQDQSGSNAAGQLNVYDSATQIDIPSFVAIGRAAQVAGTQVDITQGTIPQNPPANTSRLWVDGSGTLHLLDSSGNDRIEIDANNIASYVNPLIAATALGGDLYGTIANGHVRLQNNSTISAYDNANNAHNLLWLDATNYVDLSNAGGSLLRILNQANTVDIWHIDQTGNVTQGASLFLGNNQWIFFGAGATNGIISDNTNLYLRTNGTLYVQYTNGTYNNINCNAVHVPSGGGFFFDASGNSFLDTSSYLEMRSNAGMLIHNAAGTAYAQLTCGTFVANGNITSTANINGTNGVSSSSGAGDFAQWVRAQSGSSYLGVNGDRMTDGGDNNNWVFYGPMGSVNYVFQHRDGSWMGTQAANFQTMSDWKQKLNVTPITDQECLDRLRMPDIPIITWDAHGSLERNPTQRDIGFSAQDMETAVPEVVSIDNEGSYFLSYGNLTAVLWGALRLLDQRLTDHMNSLHPGPPNYGIPSASVAP